MGAAINRVKRLVLCVCVYFQEQIKKKDQFAGKEHFFLWKYWALQICVLWLDKKDANTLSSISLRVAFTLHLIYWILQMFEIFTSKLNFPFFVEQILR